MTDGDHLPWGTERTFWRVDDYELAEGPHSVKCVFEPGGPTQYQWRSENGVLLWSAAADGSLSLGISTAFETKHEALAYCIEGLEGEVSATQANILRLRRQQLESDDLWQFLSERAYARFPGDISFAVNIDRALKDWRKEWEQKGSAS